MLKLKKENICKFENSWILQKKKNVDMKQVKNLDQTITKFNEAIASIMKDHKTKVQNSWKRWKKDRKR